MHDDIRNCFAVERGKRFGQIEFPRTDRAGTFEGQQAFVAQRHLEQAGIVIRMACDDRLQSAWIIGEAVVLWGLPGIVAVL